MRLRDSSFVSSAEPSLRLDSDNGATNWDYAEPTARGIILDIDTDTMTATLVQQYTPISSVADKSVSQGSVQVLDNGNVVVGYGSNPWIGEYTYVPSAAFRFFQLEGLSKKARFFVDLMERSSFSPLLEKMVRKETAPYKCARVFV